jgi:hypothetical protein
MTSEPGKVAADYNLRRRLTTWALTLVVLSCAIALVLFLVSGGGVGRWLFRSAGLARTEFSSDEARRLERILGVALPANARIDMATISGHRDHEFTVRMRIPGGDVNALRSKLQMAAAPVNMAFLGTLQSAAPPWRTTPLDVEAAFQVGQASQWILCKEVNGTVTAYFEAYDWLGADLTEAVEILSAPQRPDK